MRKLGGGDEIVRRRFRPKHIAATLDRLLRDRSFAASCAGTAALFAGAAGIEQTCDLAEAPAAK